jgi:hypothetical protein
MANLKTTVLNNVDFDGMGFYAEAFREIDRHELVDFLGIDLCELDENDLRNAQDLTSSIQEGQFVLIELAN